MEDAGVKTGFIWLMTQAFIHTPMDNRNPRVFSIATPVSARWMCCHFHGTLKHYNLVQYGGT